MSEQRAPLSPPARHIAMLGDRIRPTSSTEPRTERNEFAKFIARLGSYAACSQITAVREAARRLWLRGDFRHQALAPFYAEACITLAGFTDLTQHIATLQIALKNTTSLADHHADASGRYFDSAFADELVKITPQHVLNAAKQTGNAIYRRFAELEQINPRLGKLARRYLLENIQEDPRPWFSRCSDIDAFAREPSIENLKTMLNEVRHGYHAIKMPYLAVRSGWALSDVDRVFSPSWNDAAMQYFAHVVGPERTTVQRDHVRRYTHRPGILLHDQSASDLEQPDFRRSRSWADDKQLHFDALSKFEAGTLRRGHPIVNGASGSTSILSFLYRELASLSSDHAANSMLLNTIMFLVYDGGHSVQEVAAVHDMVRHAEPPSREHLAASRRRLQSFELDYRQLIPKDPAAASVVEHSLHNAFDRTIARYSIATDSMTSPRRTFAMTSMPSTKSPKTVY